MVRCSSLPLRSLALKYGATSVYGPEVIDRSILECERVVRVAEGGEEVVEYVKKGGRGRGRKRKRKNKNQEDDEGNDGKGQVVFQTCPKLERSRLSFQLGTSNPDLAMKVARMIKDDVDVINVNMG